MTLMLSSPDDEKQRKYLINRCLVIAYLGLPAFVFLATFVRPVLAFPLALLIFLAASFIFRESISLPSLKSFALVGLCSVILLAVVGFPDGPFAWDWFKHWALLGMLVSEDWPVIADINGQPQYLRYYTGAYLVPTLISKLFESSVWITFALWLWLGYSLVLLVVLAPFEGEKIWRKMFAVLIFIAVAGADAWAMNLFRWADDVSLVGFVELHQEWWFSTHFNKLLQFSSILTSLIWVPHQSIATFLVAGLLVFDRQRNSHASSVLAFGLLALWSPYGMIGLLPLLIIRLWRDRPVLPKLAFISSMVAGIFFSLLVAWYLSEGMPSGSLCISCSLERLFFDPLPYLVFWAVELGFFLLILRRRLFTDISCLVSFAVLLILPLIAGNSPDFVMRTSLGPIFVLAVRSVETVMAGSWKKSKPVIVAFGLSLPTVVSEATYHVQLGRAHLELPVEDPLGGSWQARFRTIPESTLEKFLLEESPEIAAQYFSPNKPGPIKSTE